MKATLTFDLNEPEDVANHKLAIKATDMSLALWEILFNTRKGIEWEIEEKNLSAYEALDRVYEKIHEALEEHDININKLVI